MSDQSKILEAVEKWAHRHPNPDLPIVVRNLGRYSPRQIVDEMQRMTPDGELLFTVLRHSAKRLSLENVLHAFEDTRSVA